MKIFLAPRKISRTALVFLLLLILCGLLMTNPGSGEKVVAYGLASKIIVVDPGHGGIDPGATRGKYREKDITLLIGKKLEAYLSQAGATVILLRSGDNDLAGADFSGTIAQRKKTDLKNRVQQANEVEAHLYISIHTNADPSPRWSGAQTFYNRSSEKSKILGVCIQDEITRILKNTKRKAAPGNYYVLQNTEMPAVIIEVGFISNPKEASLLSDNDYQSQMAYAIFCGIAKAEKQEYDRYIEEYPGW